MGVFVAGCPELVSSLHCPAETLAMVWSESVGLEPRSNPVLMDSITLHYILSNV